MRKRKLNRFSGGFVLAEFAIALPLFILLGSGLAFVSIKTFELGKEQPSAYVLETEAQYILERITAQARTATKVDITDLTEDFQQLTVTYHSIKDFGRNTEIVNTVNADTEDEHYLYTVADVKDEQYYLLHQVAGEHYYKLYSQRQGGRARNPISGNNSIGMTKINLLKFKVDEDSKLLHITLELKLLPEGDADDTDDDKARKFRIATAVFMPNYGSE